MNIHSLTRAALLVGGIGGVMAVAACSVDPNGIAAVLDDSGTDSSAPDTSTGGDANGGDSTMPSEASTGDTGSGGDSAQPDGTMDGTAGDATTDGAMTDAAADVVQPEGDAGDGGSDGSTVDAAPPSCTATNCNGVCCGTRCISSRSCASCSVGHAFCPFSITVFDSNGECLPDCTACSPGGVNLNVSCFSCSGGGSPVESCATRPDLCPAIGSATACSCGLADAGSDAGACPGSAQVCAPNGGDGGASSCATCGQTMNGGTQGLLCGAGPARCGQTSATCL
ncbi:MAG: hypothetical protein ACREJ3_18535 [Polyangiaceae bacterium]